MVVGYSRGYDTPSMDTKNGFYTLRRYGQFFVYTLMGNFCTEPKLKPEEAQKELQKKLFYTFFAG